MITRMLLGSKLEVAAVAGRLFHTVTVLRGKREVALKMEDFELLKEVPGYKAILKVVLKSQIQLLIDQLCKYTGEESFILTTSASDGAQSILGSGTGKGFLENRNEIKTEFLGFCLKSLHNPEETESCLHNSRTKVRSHPYKKSQISSSTSKKLNQHNQCNGFSEFQNFLDSEKTYLNDTKKSDSRSVTAHQGFSPVPEENTDVRYNRKDNDLQQDALVAPSQDQYYETNYNQAFDNNEQSEDKIERENNVLVVKQEVDPDNVEVTGIELTSQSYIGNIDLQNNLSIAGYDDSASRSSTEAGISELPASELNVSDVSASKHYYPCQFCGRVFQHNSWLTRHLRSHTGEKPYECHICGKRFTRAGTMKVHMMMHSLK